MSLQIFVTLSSIFVKNWMKNQNLRGQNYSCYQYKQDFNCYFHDFGKKSLYHLSLSEEEHPSPVGEGVMVKV
jgi:hypothetical protein